MEEISRLSKKTQGKCMVVRFTRPTPKTKGLYDGVRLDIHLFKYYCMCGFGVGLVMLPLPAKIEMINWMYV